jgi:hypothetical protein
MTNPFATANFGGYVLVVIFGCIPLKQKEHVVRSFGVFLDPGESNKSFKFPSSIRY